MNILGALNKIYKKKKGYTLSTNFMLKKFKNNFYFSKFYKIRISLFAKALFCI